MIRIPTIPDPEHPQYAEWYSGQLLTPPDGNTKFRHTGQHSGILQYGLTLASSWEAGIIGSRGARVSVCTDSSAACRRACVVQHGGQGSLPNVRTARARKTRFFWFWPELFLWQLVTEIQAAIERSRRAGRECIFRLNTNSDLAWHAAPHRERQDLQFQIPQLFPSETFEDYTAHPVTRSGWTPAEIPENLHLTYSRKERRDVQTLESLQNGRNVAIVFHDSSGATGRNAWKQRLPDSWQGFPVIDGDETDHRTADPRPVVVGLRLKSKSRAARELAIRSGFSVFSGH